ncbi:Txe/YoeB family addiction module toxin [Levilactobacillus mulengensis]|uniref:Txe/YoeB family addiction module toxin n=1 Tax=Levilactobacillus mulengensis TaxID=2486025 RepID=UPI000F7B49A4|nr:Txe/YoeB family addiction module toxin [Levilactobacillus mulengensis]
MSYTIEIKSQVKKDLRRIKGSDLEKRFLQVIQTLKNNPFLQTQSFEKLTPPVKGFYSRRINRQHRVVYQVDVKNKRVIIFSAYSHYER